MEKINDRRETAVRSSNQRDSVARQLDDLMKAIHHIEGTIARNKRAAKQVEERIEQRAAYEIYQAENEFEQQRLNVDRLPRVIPARHVKKVRPAH